MSASDDPRTIAPPTPGVIAIDFETYYDDEVSIKPLGTRGYFTHPKFEAYLVSIYGVHPDKTPIEWAGAPTDFPWASIATNDHTWVSHNANFDANLFRALIEKGEVPDIWPREWNCTADLAAYCGLPRTLAGACLKGLGIDVSKETRSLMKGQRWEEMDEGFQKAVLQYATLDSVYCYMLWSVFADRWPDAERRFSRLTHLMGWEGVPVDEDAIEEAIGALLKAREEQENLIPWKDEPKTPLMSPKRLYEWCSEKGIPVPPSTSGKHLETIKWMEHHPGTPLEAVITIRRVNKLLRSVEAMWRRTIDGRLYYDLKYFGAHTGRDSGAGGWNSQNMPRKKLFGVNVRSLIKAPPGKKLIISDLSQIEPRCLHYLARDWALLDILEKGGEEYDFYEAQARVWGMWTKDEPLKGNDDALRHQFKTYSLGLGYGTGPAKFKVLAGISAKEAERLVALYRRKNPKIIKLWRMLDGGFKRSALKEEDYEVTLPGGRVIRYRDPKIDPRSGDASAVIMRNGAPMRVRLWGSAIAENITQALARDVFRDGVLRLTDAGFRVILRVHDEAVIEIEEETEEKMRLAAAEVKRIMSTAPDWIPNLPLGAGGEISDVYKK